MGWPAHWPPARDRLLGEGRSFALPILPSVAAVAPVPLAAGHSQPVAIAMLATSMAASGFGTVIYNVAQVSFRQAAVPPPTTGEDERVRPVHRVGNIPVGAFLGALIGGHYGALTALRVSVAGQLVPVLPVLLSPLRDARSAAGAGPARPRCRAR